MTFALSAARVSRHGCSPMIVPRAILFTLNARLPPVVKCGLSMTAIWLTLFVQIDERSKFQTQKGLIFGLV